jgi:hypothetical protein
MGKATGPRTLKGKARASENAAKHRIESGRILPSEQKDAEVLRDGLTECFNPVGLAENEVVDDILINRLIRRRIDLAFTQEYSKASAVKQQTWLDNHERTAIRLFVGSSFSRGRRRGEKDARLRPDLCIHGLEVLRSQIKDRGPQPKRDLQTLLRIFGDEPTECAALVINELAHIAVDDVTDASDQEELKKSILETIGKEVALQKHRLELTRELDDIAFASDIQEPDAPTRETLLRYRAANTREFKDLVGALELIRRLRKSVA